MFGILVALVLVAVSVGGSAVYVSQGGDVPVLGAILKPIVGPSVKCEVSDWGEFGECVDNTQVRTRTVTAEGGDCPSLQETQECTPDPVNCKVSAWGDWGDCRDSKKIRSRTVTTQPKNGGSACPALSETGDCIMTPVNCKVSAWSPYSSCVNGNRVRSRTIQTEPSYGGEPCPELTYNQSCVEYNGKVYVSGEEPIDCKVGVWSGFSKCVNGSRTKTRTVTVDPVRGGAACPTLSYKDSCVIYGGKTYKSGEEPVDCEVSGWEWEGPNSEGFLGSGRYSGTRKEHLGECVDGKMTKIRSVTVQPMRGGKTCPTLTQNVSCVIYNGKPYLTDDQPIDCVVSDWSPWTKCVDGGRSLSRTVITQPKNGGDACPALWYPQKCGTYEGKDYALGALPIDCKVSDWDEWGDCVDGKRSTTRTITTQPKNGGVACPTLTKTQGCTSYNGVVYEAGTQPVDCVVNDWSSWTNCVDGKRVRTRTIKIQPVRGGKSCPLLKQPQDCVIYNNTVYKKGTHPVDCEVSDWSWENPVSETFLGGGRYFGTRKEHLGECVDGKMTQVRSVTIQPVRGGKVCPSLLKKVDCIIYNGQTYLTGTQPVDCAVSKWSGWGDCVDNARSKSRTVTTQPLRDGKSCPPLSATSACDVYNDTAYNYSGTPKWYYNPNMEYGGFLTNIGGQLNATLEEAKAKALSMSHCKGFIRWYQENGNVVTQYKRDHPRPGYDNIPMSDDLIGPGSGAYVVDRYPGLPQDCQLGEWTSKDGCVDGQKLISRAIMEAPRGIGAECNKIERTELCPVDCAVSKWSGWGDCVDNERSKSRTVTTQPLRDGNACPPLSATSACDVYNDTTYNYSGTPKWYYNPNMEYGGFLTNIGGQLNATLEEAKAKALSMSHCKGFIRWYRDGDVVTQYKRDHPRPGYDNIPMSDDLIGPGSGAYVVDRYPGLPQDCQLGEWTSKDGCVDGQKLISRAIIEAPRGIGAECNKIERTELCPV